MSPRRKANSHKINKAATKEGNEIPETLSINKVRSKTESWRSAQMVPSMIPKKSAISVAEMAKTAVPGKVSAKISRTSFLD